MSDINLRQLDLNLLNLFEAIHETGSVTAAADRVALSQSAASHALARMRDQIGDDLFVRTGRALAPTPIGARLYPEVKTALNRLRNAIGDARGFDPTRSARAFTLAIPHIMGHLYTLRLRTRAHAAAPGVTLRFDTHTLPSDVPGDLAEGIIDLAVDWMPITRPAFVNRVLFRDHPVAIASIDHPRVRPGVSLDVLLAEETVRVKVRRPTDEMPQAMATILGYPWQVALIVSESLEIPPIVAATHLIGGSFRSASEVTSAAHGLVQVALPEEVGTLPVHAIWHESRRSDVGHAWLRGLVAAELGSP